MNINLLVFNGVSASIALVFLAGMLFGGLIIVSMLFGGLITWFAYPYLKRMSLKN